MNCSGDGREGAVLAVGWLVFSSGTFTACQLRRVMLKDCIVGGRVAGRASNIVIILAGVTALQRDVQHESGKGALEWAVALWQHPTIFCFTIVLKL
jgi:hypothetical protein